MQIKNYIKVKYFKAPNMMGVQKVSSVIVLKEQHSDMGRYIFIETHIKIFIITVH